jgi:PAT family acetyl-CoA transporter-like MFS transporter 1
MDNNLELELQVLNEETIISHQKEKDPNDKQPLKKNTNYKKDLKTIIFLMYLYLLQGIPLGLAGSLPAIMTSRKVSYSDLGTFSFVFWPFSIKLLWAPIIDSIYFEKFGRRRSW